MAKNINLQHVINVHEIDNKRHEHEAEVKALKQTIKELIEDNDTKQLIKRMKKTNSDKKQHQQLLDKLDKREQEIKNLENRIRAQEKPLLNEQKAYVMNAKHVKSLNKLQSKERKTLELERETAAKIKVLQNHNIADQQMINILSQQINDKNMTIHDVNMTIAAMMDGKKGYVELERELAQQIKANKQLQAQKEQLVAELQSTMEENEIENASLRRQMEEMQAAHNEEARAHKEQCDKLIDDIEERDEQLVSARTEANKCRQLRAMIKGRNGKYVAMKKQLLADVDLILARAQNEVKDHITNELVSQF